jgi:Second Messenger Oligonucleotide or Dinucleotide Synthetase domain
VAAPAPFFTDEPQSQIDDLLWRVCDEFQISPTRYQQAVDRYGAVCQWLEAQGSTVASFKPSMYPQGSMRIGTTVKPIGREEHDLDFVCEFRVPASVFESPLQLLKLIESRLRQHKLYAPILEVKNRCVRLNYANEFHMDILPACPDGLLGNNCLVVPDRESRWWRPSNPKGYAEWFEHRCELVLEMLMDERRRLLAKAEPIPEQEATAEKATLKRAVQLIKRWRDVRYEKTPEIAPISMVITTLAAHLYEGESSVSKAISGILDGIVALIDISKPRVVVLNPANGQEDLSERWNDPAKYAAFVTGVRILHAQWSKAIAMTGIPNVARTLESLLGAAVTVAVRKQAQHIQDLRGKSALRASPTGVITAAPAVGIAMRPSTFHGR